MNVPTPIRNAVLALEEGLKDLYGERFRGLLLYGSYARGDQREGSDVNLLLLLEGPVDPCREIVFTSDLVGRLSLDSDSLLSVIPAGVEDFRQGKSFFLRLARREAIPAAEWASYNGNAMSVLPPRIRDVVRQLEAGLKELYGDRYRGLLLYGPYARGTAWEGSVVNLLLLLDGPVDPVKEIIASEPVAWPLSLNSGLVLSVMPASFEAFQRGDGIFLDAVRQEAIPVAA
jgi:predicted nucleotidyltransferase